MYRRACTVVLVWDSIGNSHRFADVSRISWLSAGNTFEAEKRLRRDLDATLRLFGCGIADDGIDYRVAVAARVKSPFEPMRVGPFKVARARVRR